MSTTILDRGSQTLAPSESEKSCPDSEEKLDRNKAWDICEQELAKGDPFSLIEDGHLMIKTKAGEMRTFILNKAQEKLHYIIKKLWVENKIIRILILKARQLGCSTYIEALIYSITSHTENQNAVVIADDLDGANYIFEMSKLFNEKSPPHLKTPLKKSNEKKLEFEGIHSQILIDTAENKDAGRKYTFRLVHMSEKALYKKTHSDALMLGLSHSVPALPRTMIISETTANGFNQFKDEWDAAVQGLTDYIPIFIPWYWGEDYRMPVDDSFIVGDPAMGDATKDEFILSRQMEDEGITHIAERLNWRRWDIKNNCKGDLEAFAQENPSTPEEAFIASGECFFNKRILAAQLKQVRAPLFKANIVKENFKFVLRKCADGDFDFYFNPSPTGQYVIGGDACSGSGADYATLLSRDKSTNEIVATFRGKVDSDELAYRSMMLGSLLNNAVVAIENDKFGFAANAKLRTIYGNVYVQRSFNLVDNKIIEKFGWDCVTPDSLILTSDLRWVKASSMTVGDSIIGPTEEPAITIRGYYQHRYFKNQKILRIKHFKAPVVNVALEGARIVKVSNNHPFLVYRIYRSNNPNTGFIWVNAEDLKVDDNICSVPVWEQLKTYEAGRLSGLLCADGYIAQNVESSSARKSGLSLMFSQVSGELSKECYALWEVSGFSPNRKYVRHKSHTRAHHQTMEYVGVGSNMAVIEALGKLRPNRLIQNFERKNLINCISTMNLPRVSVKSIENTGYDDVIGIETSEHTLIVDGLVSHNTTAVTRHLMLSQMQEEIREGSLELREPILIRECLTFIKNPETKKAEAQEGMNDDFVIACAISGQLRHDDPYRKVEKPVREDINHMPKCGGLRFKSHDR